MLYVVICNHLQQGKQNLWLPVGLPVHPNKKVKGVPQSQTAALPRHQEKEETDKTKPAQIEQAYKATPRLVLSSLSEVIAMLKGLNKHKDKITQGKT